MKQVIKKISLVIVSGFVGLLIGYVIATLGVVLLTDQTWNDALGKFYEIDILDLIVSCLFAIIVALVSIILQVIIHEFGHLLGGLLTGYRFVSFRIFSFIVIKEAGKLRLKRFEVYGTGGQCLLLPPDAPLSQIKTAVYNWGGVFLNLIVTLSAAGVLYFLSSPGKYVTIALLAFMLIGAFVLFLNGIPMKVGGIGNDAKNQLEINNSEVSKAALVTQLRVNASLQNGMRPSEMPSEYFALPNAPIDYNNSLQVFILMLIAARHIDCFEWEAARKIFVEAYENKEKLIAIYEKEVACELVFIYLVSGEIDAARKLYSGDLPAYVERFRKVTTSKQRLLFAIALYLNDDYDKAKEILATLEKQESGYLMKGEVRSDLAVMKKLLQEKFKAE